MAYKCPLDNEIIITHQLKLLSQLIIIPCRLPEKKVIVPTGHDNALKCHRGVSIITQLFNTILTYKVFLSCYFDETSKQ